MRASVGLLGSAVLFALSPAATAAPRLPDTFLARVEALATMQTLSAEILASRSATAALEHWCGDHAMALPATIRAERVKDAPDKPIRPEQRERLAIGPEEPVRYRRVRLMCGTHALSEADNWYVPGRLTAEMNRVLDTTDTPFGRAVAALHFTRETLAASMVWTVLPSDWQRRPPPPDRPGESLDIPPELFEHQAVLYDEGHRPFSEVDEHYMRDILPF